jgi:hypothetical protein
VEVLMIQIGWMIRNSAHFSGELLGFCLFWIMDQVIFSSTPEFDFAGPWSYIPATSGET